MTKIKITMLQVEEGEELKIEFAEESNAVFMASVIKSFTDNGYVLSDVEIGE